MRIGWFASFAAWSKWERPRAGFHIEQEGGPIPPGLRPRSNAETPASRRRYPENTTQRKGRAGRKSGFRLPARKRDLGVNGRAGAVLTPER